MTTWTRFSSSTTPISTWTTPSQPWKSPTKTNSPNFPRQDSQWGRPPLLRRFRRLALPATLLCTLTTIVLGALLTCRPAWYQPASIDHARLKNDKRELTGILDEIGAALNAGQPFNLELRQEQVNRWLAARREIDVFQLDLGPLQRPQVHFLSDNRLRIAGTVSRGGFEAVLSATVKLELTDDQLVVTLDHARLGALPAPRRLIGELLRRSLASGATATDLAQSGSIAPPNDWVWPNGKRRFHVGRLRVSDGLTSLSLVPAARRP